MSLGGAAAVAAVVALVVRFTVANFIATVLGFVIRVLFIGGLVAMVAYCAQKFG